MPNGKWKRFFFKSLPPPLNTGIPDKHDFIFIKGVDTTNGDLYLWGEGQCHTRLLVLGEGDEGDKISKRYTFDLFTLSINIH